MTLYLSASSIKDFINCSKTFELRKIVPEEALTNPDMEAGKIVHQVLEKNWDLPLDGLKTKAFYLAQDLGKKYADKIDHCLETYDYLYRDLMFVDDKIEENFKIQFDDDVYLVGRIDRITRNGILIDWKTSGTKIKQVNNDPQFLIYYFAYKYLYNKEPSHVFYAGLNTGDTISFNLNPLYYSVLFNDVIPEMIKTVHNNNFARTGLFNGSCYMCKFKNICYEGVI